MHSKRRNGFEPGRVFILEVLADAIDGVSRAVDSSLRAGLRGRFWLLECDFREGGLWAGVEKVFDDILPQVQRSRPDLLRRHDYELLRVLPKLKGVMTVRNPTLTDLARPDERVRHYPADRSHRIVHGLIDLLDAFKAGDEEPWFIVCNGFEQAGPTVRRFFRELMRRRGKKLGISLFLTVAPGHGDELMEQFFIGTRGSVARVDAKGVEFLETSMSEEASLEATALLLEKEIEADPRKAEVHIAEMIHVWRKLGRANKVAEWEFVALGLYDQLGFYEEALEYGESARCYLKTSKHYDSKLRWSIFLKLFLSYVALQRPEDALRLLEQEPADDWGPRAGALVHYLSSMLHSRFLPDRDFALGEAHLERGIEDLDKAGLSEDEFHFQVVFNRNGLAMIRNFQGRFQEALDLCRRGFEELEAHLSPDKHRLHRSVLLFNMAQVYSAMGDHREAIQHFSAALDMDPNYSDYYNDRGSAYLKLGELDKAEADYLKAVELSPPYSEVYANLGQCYRLMDNFEKAVEAYSIALDLDPTRVLAFVGRGQCRAALGDREEAISDYSDALSIAPGQWDILSSRAALYYDGGERAAALSDLNDAIGLAPQIPDLYYNRAMALADQGMVDAAIDDLETYLGLAPDAEDSDFVVTRLKELRAAQHAPAVA